MVFRLVARKPPRGEYSALRLLDNGGDGPVATAGVAVGTDCRRTYGVLRNAVPDPDPYFNFPDS